MAENLEPGSEAGESGPAEEEQRTPFDNPFFLPVVLTVGTVWFGYDGFINKDPEMMKHWWFNQPGAVLLGVGALWTGTKALREHRASRESGPGSGTQGEA